MTHSLPSAARAARRARQHGGFALGMIVGLLIGLAVALGVALYIAKVPVPFVDKVPHRTPEQDAAEVERNKNWDPNAPLAGKQAGRIGEAASAVSAPPPLVAASAVDKRAAGRGDAASAAKSGRDPAAILAGQSPSASSGASGATGKPAGDPFIYFVQAGAYSNADDAEQQRARLAMQGLSAKVSEREQSGRTVYRVRLGPFNNKEEAESNQERLKEGGAEAVLVRVERGR